MLRNKLYYGVKPMVPLSIRRGVRRWFAARKRGQVGAIWPIFPGSETPPANWSGWPAGKKFALVLTHDVESSVGLSRCRQLMELEQQRGLRSSFNFIPEGDYSVTREFRQDLVGNGFEVGVHDLYHDGKLYSSRESFCACAAKINNHLREWDAVGFRSGFMHHNLPWLHDLDISYDASTFDTDPFEPQPDSAHTIFPFWVPKDSGRGYVEMPYTLPQDSTLFLILREESPQIWRRKLDWIAEHGGMALFNVHPDYMDFTGQKKPREEYPSEFYREILDYVRSKYEGRYWNALPREVADHVRSFHGAANGKSTSVHFPAPEVSTGKKIWIDLDNTPHVPLFAPVVNELSKRGYEVVLTARDAFQVCDLAEKMKLRFIKIGRHHGKNKIRKVAGLFYRALQLAPVVLREKPAVGLSHGSRSQILICNLLGVPTILMADYEFAQYPPLMRPLWEMAPDVIPDSALSCPSDKIKKYPGIKEDIYVPDFQPDPSLLAELGLDARNIIAVARPPATEAHYHNPEAEKLFARFMDRAIEAPNVQVVLLPRNQKQAEVIKAASPGWFEGNRTIIPERAVNGLNLIWHSDLVVSGGGTMNREAAALHVPVYSVFRGKIGAVDHQLQKEGRLTLIESLADVDHIRLERRDRSSANGSVSTVTLERVVDHIIDVVERNGHSVPELALAG
ncbi:MAG TPA: DUF354 domain-containing protein [Verrucomicrobiae bacterium]|jgi:hypothetical protein